MSKSNTWENELALLFFNNTNAAGIGDATGLRGSSTAGSLYLALHTADPGEAGNQGTSEIAYTGYARQAIARSGAGFTVSTNSATNAADISFPEMSGGAGGTATYWSLGDDVSGAGKIRYSGAITGALSTTPIITGIIPRFVAGALSITED